MTGDQLLPLAAIFTGVVAVNLAVAWLLVRRSREGADPFGSVAARSSDADRDGPGVGGASALGPDAATGRRGDGGEGDPPPLDADGDTVVCRHCGAENRSGYRFCRWCVQSGFVDEDAGVAAGGAMTDRSL
jgi:hypothetical protein